MCEVEVEVVDWCQSLKFLIDLIRQFDFVRIIIINLREEYLLVFCYVECIIYIILFSCQVSFMRYFRDEKIGVQRV